MVDELAFTVALRTIDFGDSNDEQGKPRWRSIGFDLDDRCTGEGEAPSCAAPAWPTLDLGDGPAGRDNALGAMTLDGNQFASVSDLLSNDMAAGKDSLAIRVSSYNGLNDDDQLTVEVIGIRFGIGTPGWAGKDVWKPIARFVVSNAVDPLRANYLDNSAYVKDRWLVANFAEVEIAVGLVLKGGVLVARIAQDSGGGWTLLDGTFGGIASMPDLLGMGKYFGEEGKPPLLCPGFPLYETIFKPLVCKYADIRYSLPLNDPSLPCDSASVGFDFAVMPAQVGTDVDDTEADQKCAEQYAALPPEGDTCDSLAMDR